MRKLLILPGLLLTACGSSIALRGRALKARLIVVSFALSVMSAIGASPATASDEPLGLPCAAKESVQICQWNRVAPDRRVRTWDGVPLDVRVVLPAERSGPLPLVAFLGGYPGGLGPATGEFLTPSQVSLAKSGYAVLAISPRGTFHSCGYRPQSTPLAPDACLDGYIRLADSRYEVRDVQHLAGLLADEGYADPKRIGAVGESYGGGQTLQLAALRDRIRLPNGDMVPWLSPEGRAMRIAGVTAATAWHDLGYSLVPNGRLTATGAAEDDAGRRPAGVMKASLYAGFEGLSILGFLPTEPLPTYHPPPGRDPDADFYGWGAALEKGEPYEDPVVKHMLAELRANHSVAGIPFAGRPAPVLFANGFADDLFPVEEAVRYLERVNDVPGAHAAGLLGNWGHGRSTSNAVDRDALRARTVAWLDRWVRGDESIEVLSGIEARPLDCGNATSSESAPSAPARQARDWRRLAAAHRRFTEPGRRLVTSSVVDPAGASVDPVAAPGTSCQPLAADDVPGAVTYRFAAGEGFTVLGSPVITADVRVLGARAEDTQLAARLWEVDPSTHKQRLISRTLYRPRGGPLAAQRQSFELQGAGWRLPPGREIKLELLGADAPFGRPSNAPFELEITNLELDLPVAD